MKLLWVGLVIALVACSSPLDTRDVERQVSRQLDQSRYDQWGTITYDVTCPDEIDGKAGYRFNCDFDVMDTRSVTGKSGSGSISVEVLNANGQVLIDD